MGHQFSPEIPRTRRWKYLVEQLEDTGVATDTIFESTLWAAETGLANAAIDRGLSYPFWLLSYLVHSASGNQFHERLNAIGIGELESQSSRSLIASLLQNINRKRLATEVRSHVWDISSAALYETLQLHIQSSEQTVFGTQPLPPQTSLKAFASHNRFVQLSKDFLSSFLNKYICQIVERELANHVGQNKRFKNLADIDQFSINLKKHCRDIVVPTEPFLSDWFRRRQRLGTLSQGAAAGFIEHAIEKIIAEFKRQGEP